MRVRVVRDFLFFFSKIAIGVILVLYIYIYDYRYHIEIQWLVSYKATTLKHHHDSKNQKHSATKTTSVVGCLITGNGDTKCVFSSKVPRLLNLKHK